MQLELVILVDRWGKRDAERERKREGKKGKREKDKSTVEKVSITLNNGRRGSKR